MDEISTKVGSGKVEVVWTCEAKTGAICRKEGDGNRSTRGEREESQIKDGWRG